MRSHVNAVGEPPWVGHIVGCKCEPCRRVRVAREIPFFGPVAIRLSNVMLEVFGGLTSLAALLLIIILLAILLALLAGL